MDLFLVLYIALSIFALSLLLSTPYLRITSLGWFIAIWTIPFLGAVLFLLTVVRSRKTGHDECFHSMLERDLVSTTLFEKLGVEYHFLPYFRASETKILRDDEFIDELYSCIDNAQDHIWITTYILSGNVKIELIERLKKAHERGVEVLLLVDRIGSGLVLASHEKPLKVDGVPFRVAVMHDSRTKSIFFMEKRLHSKIVIADDIAIVGAHNLRDEVLETQQNSVRNISLKFSGSVVFQLEAVFADLWNKNSGKKIVAGSKSPTDENGMLSRIIFSDPIERSHFYNGYLTLLFNAARKRICIWMPYVIPTQSMRSTIIAASRIGLDVRVLVPKKSDSSLVDNAHALVIKEFVDNGVKCAQSEGKFDHSKLILVDDLVIIGSTNLDYRSLYRNYEANIEIENECFSQSIMALFDESFESAIEVKNCKQNALVHMRNQLTSLIAGLY